MAIEPLGSVMTIQSQTAQKPVKSNEAVDNKEVSTPAQVTNVDPMTVSVSKPNSKDGEDSGNQNAEQQQQATNDKIKKAVEQLNRNMPHSEAVFGIHEKTNRVTIKIVDKDTKEIIKEFVDVFAVLFSKKQEGADILFMLLYRLDEDEIVQLIN
mgnify:CR=1 FL=1